MLLLHSVRFFSIRTYWIWSFQWIKKKKKGIRLIQLLNSLWITAGHSGYQLSGTHCHISLIQWFCFFIEALKSQFSWELIVWESSTSITLPFLCYTEEIKSYRFGLLWYDYRANAVLCSTKHAGKSVLWEGKRGEFPPKS